MDKINNEPEYYKDKSLDSLEGETWLDIPGYDGIYSISNFGRVKSERRYNEAGRLIKEKILSQSLMRSKKNKQAFLYVTLYAIVKKSYPVHNLVGITFLEEKVPVKNGCFMHLNKNTLDNRSENIIYGKRRLSSLLNYALEKQLPKGTNAPPPPDAKSIYIREKDGVEFIGGNGLKKEYGKDVRPNIESGIKKGKKRYGSYWKKVLI